MLARSMAVRPTRPSRPALRERFERRQDDLVSGAAREFARRGYDQTTMQELAASMGLATGALYLLARARELESHGGSPEARLRALVRVWVAHVCAHRDHMLVFQQERHQIESGERWRAVRASRKAFEQLVARVLDEVPARVESRLARLALLGMVNHTAQWYRPRGPLSPAQIADGYLDSLLDTREVGNVLRAEVQLSSPHSA
jgi:AcrR family transcriptional regulator